MKYNKTLTICVIAVLLTLFLAACGEIGDPRYNGWARYKDKIDGYTLFVPPEWSVTDLNIPGMRGSRFYNEVMYTGERSAFVYFAVIVSDDAGPSSPLEEVGRNTISLLTDGIWKTLNLKVSENSSPDVVRFSLSGEPYYSSYKLKGQVTLHRADGKLYYLAASATRAAYSELNATYQKIFQGFQP